MKFHDKRREERECEKRQEDGGRGEGAGSSRSSGRGRRYQFPTWELAFRESDLPPCAAVLESAMLVTWKAATHSTSAMESYLRRAAKEGATQKVASLLERSVVNLLSVDKVRGWVGCVVRGWPTW